MLYRNASKLTAFAILTLLVTGCANDASAEKAGREIDEMAAAAEDSAEDAANAIEDAAEDVADSAEDAADAAEDAVDEVDGN